MARPVAYWADHRKNKQMAVDVKPLTHWVIYKGYKVRFTERSNGRAAGLLTTAADEQIAFTYDASQRIVELPGERIRINQHGWELEHLRG